MISLTQQDEVFVLDLGDDSNVLTFTSMKQISDALDSVAQADARATLLTVASGKSWTTGFDLDFISSRNSSDEEVQEIIRCLEKIVLRLIRLPVMSIAAIQGHCFAGGAIFAMAHDLRMMRADQGFFCLPEVELSVPFTPGISALLQMKLPASTAYEAMLSARRYGGIEALQAGIVDQIFPIDELRDKALAHAKSLAAFAGKPMQNARIQLSHDVIRLLSA